MGPGPTYQVSGGGGGGGGGGDAASASYWIDAAEEDVGLSGIDFTEFESLTLPFSLDDCCFGDIDGVLEGLSKDGSKPAAPAPLAEAAAAMPAVVENVNKEAERNVEKSESGAVNGDGRYSNNKRLKIGDGRLENRGYPPGRNDGNREFCGRRRSRSGEWEERDWRRREGDHRRKRDRDGGDKRDWRDRDRDRVRDRDRESRGYWARDSSGKVVYRMGPWEADQGRDAKKLRLENSEEGRKSPGKEEKKERPAEEQARKYQLDVLEQAKKKNTIAFLETGAGKTLIAVLLMKSVCAEMRKDNRKMLAIFLVPKVPLVYQQAEVIRERTGYNVGHYCGEMGQDFWDARKWQREFESKEVKLLYFVSQIVSCKFLMRITRSREFQYLEPLDSVTPFLLEMG